MTEPRAVQTLTRTAPSAKVLRLLHVEDNLADALLVQELICDVQTGVLFDTAARLGDLTAERVAAADCAILDLSLPDASGLHALMVIRGMSEELPIIVLTGLDDLDLGVAALQHGAEDYLVKNHVDGYTLQRAIRYAVERRRLRLATGSAAAGSAPVGLRSAKPAVLTEESGGPSAAVGVHSTAASAAAPGQTTHSVAVVVDEETGEYALRCQSCGWVAGPATAGLHSWGERQLETALLDHVDFASLRLDAPAGVALTGRLSRGATGGDEASPRVGRRDGVPTRRRFAHFVGLRRSGTTSQHAIDRRRAGATRTGTLDDAKRLHPAGSARRGADG